MGLIEALKGHRTYIDANLFIYAVEQVAPFAAVLDTLFRQVASGAQTAVTSELTLAEVLVRPFAATSEQDRMAFERAVRTQGGLRVVPVSRGILVEAARLRASTRLKLPDAIHLATAMQYECPVFLTNDTRIRTLPGLDVLYLSDYAPT